MTPRTSVNIPGVSIMSTIVIAVRLRGRLLVLVAVGLESILVPIAVAQASVVVVIAADPVIVNVAVVMAVVARRSHVPFARATEVTVTRRCALNVAPVLGAGGVPVIVAAVGESEPAVNVVATEQLLARVAAG